MQTFIAFLFKTCLFENLLIGNSPVDSFLIQLVLSSFLFYLHEVYQVLLECRYCRDNERYLKEDKIATLTLGLPYGSYTIGIQHCRLSSYRIKLIGSWPPESVTSYLCNKTYEAKTN